MSLIVAAGSPAVRASLDATTLPIVFLSGNPIGAGFVATLAKPGGKATGVSGVTTELNQKCISFLHELVPRAKRIFYLRNPTNPLTAVSSKEVETAASTLGMHLVFLDARNAHELDGALRAIRRNAADGIFVSQELFFLGHKSRIATAVRASRLPAMFSLRDYHDDSILMSYGGSVKEAMRRTAAYVDKILKGANPSDIPVEQLSTYELIIDRPLLEALGEVLAEAKQTPVVASGGIGNGEGIRKVLTAGASGAMLGTRFVATQESWARPDYKAALSQAKARDTTLTVCFEGGWPNALHRVLRNRVFERWESAGCPPVGKRPGEGEVVGTLGERKIIRYSTVSPRDGATGALDDLCLYAGQSVEHINDIPPAGKLVERLWAECLAG